MRKLWIEYPPILKLRRSYMDGVRCSSMHCTESEYASHVGSEWNVREVEYYTEHHCTALSLGTQQVGSLATWASRFTADRSLLKSDSQQLEFVVQPFRQLFRFTKATDLNVRRFLVPAASDIPRMDPGSQFSDHPWIRERLKPTGDQSGSSATVHSSEQ